MQFDFTLGAYQSQKIDIRGRFFKYVSGNSTSTIRVSTDTGESIDLLPGQGVWNVDYQWLSVQDRSGATNVGKILAGNFDFHDDRISGTVDVVDGGKARTKASVASMGYGSCPQGASTEFTHVQLYNPATSGINLFIEQVGFYSNIPPANAPSGVQIAQFSTPFANLYANPARKRMGAPNSVAELRTTTNTVRQTQGTILAAIDATQKLVRFSEPIMLAPGTGVVVAANNINETIGAYFEFFEEPV